MAKKSNKKFIQDTTPLSLDSKLKGTYNDPRLLRILDHYENVPTPDPAQKDKLIKIGITTPCLVYKKSLRTKGTNYEYYKTTFSKKCRSFCVRVHRLFYAKFVDENIADVQIDHLCCNRECAQPNHLEAVSPQENINRVYERRDLDFEFMMKTCCKIKPIDSSKINFDIQPQSLELHAESPEQSIFTKREKSKYTSNKIDFSIYQKTLNNEIKTNHINFDITPSLSLAELIKQPDYDPFQDL